MYNFRPGLTNPKTTSVIRTQIQAQFCIDTSLMRLPNKIFKYISLSYY
jgi:hypothetical protein